MRGERRRLRTAAEREARRGLAKRLLLTLVVAVVGVATVRFLFTLRPGQPVLDESDIFTVMSVVGGYSGRHSANFAHRVRADSGLEATMTFGHVYPKGTRVWVSYRRNTVTNRVRVKLYARREDAPPAETGR